VVTFAELRDAEPRLWHEAALDLRTASVLHDDTCDEIHANGVRKLEDNWFDALGDLAKGELVALADKFRAAGLLDGGAASALDTLQDAVDIAKRECEQAVESAVNRGLTVSADGRVSLPADTTGLDVELLEFYRDHAQRMIERCGRSRHAGGRGGPLGPCRPQGRSRHHLGEQSARTAG
jgi:hypothetical protein